MKSGFVNIIGNPNAGKSTLMNALMGDKLSITTHKAQTTRKRILGILNGDNYQMVFSDTPGLVNPHYKLHQTMLDSIYASIEDADIFVLISDRGEDFKNADVVEKIKQTEIPLIVIINKIDISNQQEIQEKIDKFTKEFPQATVIPVSALHNFNIETLKNILLEKLPEAEAYYPQDYISDRDVRFFVTEIIREKILLHYEKEIPYSVEIVVEEYKETDNLDRIRAIIYVERDSQKSILIGKQGSALKRIGHDARIEIEKFVEKKVFLELFVKVMKDWRNNDKVLKQFGYL
ncbi:GTPase Era [Bacteroidia bacterium]|nr:GTPase Era [Bacteroidia bacterium]